MIEVNSLYLIKCIRDNPNIKLDKDNKIVSNSHKSSVITSLSDVISSDPKNNRFYYCYNNNQIVETDNFTIGSNWYGKIVCLLDVDTKDIFIHKKEEYGLLCGTPLYVYGVNDDIDVLHATLVFGITKTQLTEDEYDTIFN